MTKEAGVGDQDSDEEVEYQRRGPGGNVVGTEGEVWVLLVRLDGFGSQEEEYPDTADGVSEGQGGSLLNVLPCALHSSVGSEDEAFNQGVTSTREKTEC